MIRPTAKITRQSNDVRLQRLHRDQPDCPSTPIGIGVRLGMQPRGLSTRADRTNRRVPADASFASSASFRGKSGLRFASLARASGVMPAVCVTPYPPVGTSRVRSTRPITSRRHGRLCCRKHDGLIRRNSTGCAKTSLIRPTGYLAPQTTTSRKLGLAGRLLRSWSVPVRRLTSRAGRFCFQKQNLTTVASLAWLQETTNRIATCDSFVASNRPVVQPAFEMSVVEYKSAAH